MIEQALDRAAEAIAGSDAILIGAGAGMGVDSGLPDFRGNQGFWRAYPPYERLGLDFVSLANPRWFVEDPTLAWGFYGHRMELYRRTEPHRGLRESQELVRSDCARADSSSRRTSTGTFSDRDLSPERIVEVHGSFDGMQCTCDCGVGIFPGEPIRVAIDPETMRADCAVAECPRCGAVARPNILMFGDFGWNSTRTDGQMRRMREWLGTLRGAKLTIIEFGAGRAVPTVRRVCEDVARNCDGTLIRINTREAEVPAGHISLPMGGSRRSR